MDEFKCPVTDRANWRESLSMIIQSFGDFPR